MVDTFLRNTLKNVKCIYENQIKIKSLMTWYRRWIDYSCDKTNINTEL